MSASVGLVFVSHSDKVAAGLVEIARQMAPSVAMAAAGGTDDQAVGTSFQKVGDAIRAVNSGSGVVILCDLGSAILTAETAIELLDPPGHEVHIVDAPLVEGAVAAAVAAETGAPVAEVIAAAQSANRSAPDDAKDPPAAAGGYRRIVTLTNRDGLHARPAAEFVKLAATFGVPVTVNQVDAKSLLGIMSLGLVSGATVEIASDESGGAAAVDALADLVESGFGEK
ncbi:MAG: dihydroxyacetone kinase phosphoryl donor subunit DhaM [Microbacteriaceae bacterium]